MSGSKLYPVPETAKRDALIDQATYDSWYRESLESPQTFWAARANELLDWMSPWHTVHSGDFGKGEAHWFDGATLNVSVNCIDRQLATRADQTAIIWEGDEPDQAKHISYRELYEQVCKLANALKARGVKKGDRVCIYMPMIPEAA